MSSIDDLNDNFTLLAQVLRSNEQLRSDISAIRSDLRVNTLQVQANALALGRVEEFQSKHRDRFGGPESFHANLDERRKLVDARNERQDAEVADLRRIVADLSASSKTNSETQAQILATQAEVLKWQSERDAKESEKVGEQRVWKIVRGVGIALIGAAGAGAVELVRYLSAG